MGQEKSTSDLGFICNLASTEMGRKTRAQIKKFVKFIPQNYCVCQIMTCKREDVIFCIVFGMQKCDGVTLTEVMIARI